jgi:serine/threonine protein phosphatase PrpC
MFDNLLFVVNTQFNLPRLMSQYKIEAGTGQHIGDRLEQQDRTALFGSPKAPGYVMAVVADGMGGLSGGSLAAEQVIRSAQQNFERFSPPFDKVEEMLQTIACDAHTIIKLTAMSSEKQPHSTMVILVVTPDKSAIWAHVGDSRLYRFEGPNCAERTVDHSYVEQLLAEGKITPDEAPDHHLANILTNVIGSTSSELFVTTGRRDGLKAGDSFLLCTDGLWHYFSDVELGAAIAVNSPRQASEMLINKARERGAGADADNCTMAIIKLVALPKEVKDYTITKMRRAV